MASRPIVSWIPAVFQTKRLPAHPKVRRVQEIPLFQLVTLAREPGRLPGWFQASPTAMRYLALLAILKKPSTRRHRVHGGRKRRGLERNFSVNCYYFLRVLRVSVVK